MLGKREYCVAAAGVEVAYHGKADERGDANFVQDEQAQNRHRHHRQDKVQDEFFVNHEELYGA